MTDLGIYGRNLEPLSPGDGSDAMGTTQAVIEADAALYVDPEAWRVVTKVVADTDWGVGADAFVSYRASAWTAPFEQLAWRLVAIDGRGEESPVAGRLRADTRPDNPGSEREPVDAIRVTVGDVDAPEYATLGFAVRYGGRGLADLGATDATERVIGSLLADGESLTLGMTGYAEAVVFARQVTVDWGLDTAVAVVDDGENEDEGDSGDDGDHPTLDASLRLTVGADGNFTPATSETATKLRQRYQSHQETYERTLFGRVTDAIDTAIEGDGSIYRACGDVERLESYVRALRRTESDGSVDPPAMELEAAARARALVDGTGTDPDAPLVSLLEPDRLSRSYDRIRTHLRERREELIVETPERAVEDLLAPVEAVTSVVATGDTFPVQRTCEVQWAGLDAMARRLPGGTDGSDGRDRAGGRDDVPPAVAEAVERFGELVAATRHTEYLAADERERVFGDVEARIDEERAAVRERSREWFESTLEETLPALDDPEAAPKALYRRLSAVDDLLHPDREAPEFRRSTPTLGRLRGVTRRLEETAVLDRTQRERIRETHRASLTDLREEVLDRYRETATRELETELERLEANAGDEVTAVGRLRDVETALEEGAETIGDGDEVSDRLRDRIADVAPPDGDTDTDTDTERVLPADVRSELRSSWLEAVRARTARLRESWVDRLLEEIESNVDTAVASGDPPRATLDRLCLLRDAVESPATVTPVDAERDGSVATATAAAVALLGDEESTRDWRDGHQGPGSIPLDADRREAVRETVRGSLEPALEEVRGRYVDRLGEHFEETLDRALDPTGDGVERPTGAAGPLGALGWTVGRLTWIHDRVESIPSGSKPDRSRDSDARPLEESDPEAVVAAVAASPLLDRRSRRAARDACATALAAVAMPLVAAHDALTLTARDAADERVRDEGLLCFRERTPSDWLAAAIDGDYRGVAAMAEPTVVDRRHRGRCLVDLLGRFDAALGDLPAGAVPALLEASLVGPSGVTADGRAVIADAGGLEEALGELRAGLGEITAEEIDPWREWILEEVTRQVDDFLGKARNVDEIAQVRGEFLSALPNPGGYEDGELTVSFQYPHFENAAVVVGEFSDLAARDHTELTPTHVDELTAALEAQLNGMLDEYKREKQWGLEDKLLSGVKSSFDGT